MGGAGYVPRLPANLSDTNEATMSDVSEVVPYIHIRTIWRFDISIH